MMKSELSPSYSLFVVHTHTDHVMFKQLKLFVQRNVQKAADCQVHRNKTSPVSGT